MIRKAVGNIFILLAFAAITPMYLKVFNKEPIWYNADRAMLGFLMFLVLLAVAGSIKSQE